VPVRAEGAVGCNIDVGNIPEIGKIFFVQNGVVKSKDDVLEKWSKTDFVKSAQSVESKGWLLDVLMCVEKIKQAEFSLEDVYGFEGVLQARHPSNNNGRVKAQGEPCNCCSCEMKGGPDFVGRRVSDLPSPFLGRPTRILSWIFLTLWLIYANLDIRYYI